MYRTYAYNTQRCKLVNTSRNTHWVIGARSQSFSYLSLNRLVGMPLLHVLCGKTSLHVRQPASQAALASCVTQCFWFALSFFLHCSPPPALLFPGVALLRKVSSHKLPFQALVSRAKNGEERTGEIQWRIRRRNEKDSEMLDCMWQIWREI